MFENITEYEIIDGNTYHNSLYKDGNICTPHNWHDTNMKPLCNKLKDIVFDGIRIIDYGTGTGGSAIEIVKILENKNIKNYKLYLVDPLKSWFYKAYKIFGSNNNIEYKLSSSKTTGKRIFYDLYDLVNEKVDVVVMANTIHLIKNKNLDRIFKDISCILKTSGVFMYSSGDISINDSNNLNGTSRKLFNTFVDKNNTTNKCEKIFPKTFCEDELHNKLNCYFNILHENKKIQMTQDELLLFYKTPRLRDVYFSNEMSIITKEQKLKEYLTQLCNQNKEYIWKYGYCDKKG